MKRHTNNGLRKVCGCSRRTWAKCPHSWYLNFKPRGGPAYRLSLDKYLDRHIDSKTAAEEEAEKIRAAIRAGTFGSEAGIPRSEMTLQHLVDRYQKDYVAVYRSETAAAFAGALRTVCRTIVERTTQGGAPLGEWRVADITTGTVERFRKVRHDHGFGPVGTNRLCEQLRACFNWGLRVGEVDATPFARHGQATVKLDEESPRTRRLNPDINEEGKLLAACGPHLRAMVECALEAGLRKGEITSLQWKDIVGLAMKGKTLSWSERPALVVRFREKQDEHGTAGADLV